MIGAPIAGPGGRVAAVRVGWGTLLVTAPGRVLATLPGVQSTPGVTAIARLLGVRHLTQGAAALAGSQIARRAWWIDASHSATMLGLAASSPTYRRLAGADAMVAAAFATATRWRPASPRG